MSLQNDLLDPSKITKDKPYVWVIRISQEPGSAVYDYHALGGKYGETFSY